jgi:hypothetical protein
MSSLSINNLNTHPLSTSEIYSPKNDFPSRKQTTTKVKIFLIAFRDQTWGYVKNTGQIVKGGLTITARVIPKFDPAIAKALSGLGLALSLNALAVISQYPGVIDGFLENLRINDLEGVILSGLSLIVSPFEALDSVMTFTSSLNGFEIIPAITIFSLIALPMAISMLSYAVIRETYGLVRLGIHMAQTPRSITEEQIESLKISLEKKLRVTAEERAKIEHKYLGNNALIEHKIELLKTRKINILTRHTDQKIVAIMTHLLEHLDKSTPELLTTNHALSDMHTLMRRKITIGSLNALTNLIFCVSLIAGAVLPISVFIIPSIALARSAFFMGKQAYLTNFYCEGLHLPEFAKAE